MRNRFQQAKQSHFYSIDGFFGNRSTHFKHQSHLDFEARFWSLDFGRKFRGSPHFQACLLGLHRLIVTHRHLLTILLILCHIEREDDPFFQFYVSYCVVDRDYCYACKINRSFSADETALFMSVQPSKRVPHDTYPKEHCQYCWLHD